MISEDHNGFERDSWDVCIVGGGPVGIALAIRLAEFSISVLLLEAGGLKSDASIQALSSAVIEDPNAHCDMEIAVARRLGGTSNLWGGRCLPFGFDRFHDAARGRKRNLADLQIRHSTILFKGLRAN